VEDQRRVRGITGEGTDSQDDDDVVTGGIFGIDPAAPDRPACAPLSEVR